MEIGKPFFKNLPLLIVENKFKLHRVGQVSFSVGYTVFSKAFIPLHGEV